MFRAIQLALCLAVMAVMAGQSQAAVVMSMVDKLDGTVELTYTGYINTAGLTALGPSNGVSSGIAPSGGLIQRAGVTSLFFTGSSTAGQTFGTGGLTVATTSSGSAINVNFNSPTTLALPGGYVSGGAISGSMTFSGSFASLGINPVARTFSWGLGGAGSSVSLTFSSGTGGAVPEPTSMAIFGIGALGIAYRARRKTKV
jgi:hypothetical protein